MAEHSAHVLHRELLAHTVGGAEGEREVRPCVVCDARCGLFLRLIKRAGADAGCDEPAVRPECLGVGEVPGIPMDGVGVDANIVAFGDVTSRPGR